MSDRLVLAIPSMGDGGLEAQRSAHFGHCDCFTVVELADGRVESVRTIANPPHEHGGCLSPVGLLASEGVQAILAAGMGARPLMGFREAGISVYFENQTPGVGEAVDVVISGDVVHMDDSQTCRHH